MTDHARSSKRYPSKQELLVHCDTWSEFAQLYASDVSQGGMFIVTDNPPPILSEIQIVLNLPEAHRVSLRASVVHVIDAEQAARENRAPGVGVQFIDLDPPRKQQIQQLVDFARWEGDNPGASYASRLFEVSASLPPSKVLQALPAGPEPFAPGSRAPSGQPAARPSQQARPVSSQRPRRNSAGAPASGPSRRPAGAANGTSMPAAAQAPPKPTDTAKLKLGMTHLAHKRFEEAIKTFEVMLRDNPGDRQTRQWLHIAHARLLLRKNDENGAAEHYQKALEAAEDNHEARKFVREHQLKKRLNALPFGRYFVKKS